MEWISGHIRLDMWLGFLWRWLASSGFEALQAVAADLGHDLMLDCGWRPKAIEEAEAFMLSTEI